MDTIELLKEVVGLSGDGYLNLMCSCDTEVDKETGDYPPDSNLKNYYDEPVWRNEICLHCRIKTHLEKLC